MSLLHDALDALSAAHGPQALAAAFRRVQRSVRQQRVPSTEGRQMATAVMTAVDLRAQLKADGATGDDLNAGLEATIRDTWPVVRAWTYLCEACRDTGLEILACPARPCDRRRAHGAHEYGVPCHCAKGDRWRDRPPSADDAVVAAAKTSKPTQRGFRQVSR